jgi:ribose-phosphate pyrophosphokinase
MPKRHDFKLFAGSSHPELAEKIARSFDRPMGGTELKSFSCSEQYVALMETVRDQIAFLIQTCREGHVDTDYMQLFLMSNAAVNAYSKKRVAVVPHFGYARQDKIHKKREPISARMIADTMEANGIDHLITCQLHSDQIQGFFRIPVDHVKAHALFADYFRKKHLENLAVVSTDAGGVKNAKELADLLNAELAILHKERPRHNESVVTQVVGNVKGKNCIVYDDMIDTAGSVSGARKALANNGAGDVYLAATHAIFSGPAIERLKEAHFKEVVVSDTLPLGPEKQFEGLKQISIAPLITEKIIKIVNLPQPRKENELG